MLRHVNRLFYGDNLKVLRGGDIPPGSVDLVYLDPPFNSDRVYNIVFDGAGDAGAQIQAFDDTWKWSNETEAAYDDMTQGGGLPPHLADYVVAFRGLLRESNLMAYLVNMAPRLYELHRVLKSTGSLYIHCDPTASHYLKVLLDAIFEAKNFRNEIIWRRTGAHNKVRRFGPSHDVILFYTKSEDYYWKSQRKRYMRGHIEDYFVEDEHGWHTNYYGNVLTGSGLRGGLSGQPWRGFNPSAKGRHWAIPRAIVQDCGEDLSALNQHEKLDRLYDLGYIKIVKGQAWPMYQHYITPSDGTPAPDIWAYQPYTEGMVFGTEAGIDADVRWLSPKDSERLGYPTQKPVGLLSRILSASCPPDGVVLDPFCGCGTTLDAAVSLDRQWIGIDITYIAIDLIRNRLRQVHGDSIDATYEVLGVPADLAAAHALFARSPFDFERWAVSLVRGTPNQHQVGDKGKDGAIRFATGRKSRASAIVSVKGGKQLAPTMVRDLEGVVGKTKDAEVGVLITLHTATKGMREAASTAGNYEDPFNNRHPRIQILSVEELLHGKKVSLPPIIPPYTEARRRLAEEGQQLAIAFGGGEEAVDDVLLQDDGITD